MMSAAMRRLLVLLIPLAGAISACGGRSGPETPSPTDAGPSGASRAEVDSLWQRAQASFRRGKWEETQKLLDRALLEFAPGDARIPQAHFWLGEVQFALGNQLQAAREFRRVSDDTPNDPLAAEALLRVADAYADLWRRPELDPSYGQTALATYQELLNRYPGGAPAARAQARINELQEKFAYKEYRAGLYYYRLKAYDSAILYLKSVVANYPRAGIAPEALTKLVEAYRRLGYREDVQETCGYIRQFHPEAPEANRVCPSATSEPS
jgi:outer membrane protein assembly factor BamD